VLTEARSRSFLYRIETLRPSPGGTDRLSSKYPSRTRKGWSRPSTFTDAMFAESEQFENVRKTSTAHGDARLEASSKPTPVRTDLEVRRP